MATPFQGYEVEARLRPSAEAYGFDLDRVLAAVVALEAQVPDDAYTAGILGTERLGNGVVVSPTGLVLTMAYLITEAREVILTLNDGRRVPAHVLGFDSRTGLGLVQALEPLNLPVMPIGTSQGLIGGAGVIVAGAGGRSHAAAGQVLTRMPFAGYWEFLLDEAIMAEPAHPHWSGAALIGPKGDLVGLGYLSLETRSADGRAKPINMFVPADLLPPILDDLARGRPPHAPRPWLGVFAQEIENHVVVVGVSPKGPAARAELKPGDVILAVAGRPVATLAEFYSRLWAQGPAGATIPLRLLREHDSFEVEIRSMDRATLLQKPRLN
ncbi:MULTISPECIES: S1C family serine protease [unclassified Caulobacter]|uniref:S1C family serine protease n=1 Tax=unclassified Caulobacter TaxID=2648921 RepID=UPI000D3973D1|nr:MULTISPECIES: S1C family serine protease [unclassified Caulobacter]PTS90687.1 signal protein PDZ [Caulobacter sp. HMWF009]PTT13089.1 signal protein PDZ [Caulobacter sp. HMWF025]